MRENHRERETWEPNWEAKQEEKYKSTYKKKKNIHYIHELVISVQLMMENIMKEYTVKILLAEYDVV